MSVQSGIYEIRNTITGKCYVGSTTDLQKREREHIFHLERGTHHNEPLQRAYQKHGKNRLIFTVVLSCLPEDLLILEQTWIDANHPEYNTCYFVHAPMLGRHHTEESKKKMSESLKQTWTDNRRLELSKNNPMKDPDIADKNVAGRRGKPLSVEHRRKLSKARRARRDKCQ